jgi:hypothetical protein
MNGSRDPYPVTTNTVWTLWSGRPEQMRRLIEDAGYVQIEGGRYPVFEDRHGGRAELDDILRRIEWERRDLKYALYQMWMDLSRRGY